MSPGEIIEKSKNIVFFGGAGVSTESGIPDFRSQDGLYNVGLYNEEYDFPPEEIISRSFFESNPSEFFRFYRNKMLFPDAKPNAAHIWLAKNNVPVITQNIDGLHQAAGSKEVYELHGSVWRNFCTKCNHAADLDAVVKLIDGSGDFIPKCASIIDGKKCDGIYKPDVVLYEEPLNQKIWQGAIDCISKADTLIIGGTSMVVYPAASIIRYFMGTGLIAINKSHLDIPPSPTSCQINSSITQFFSNFL